MVSEFIGGAPSPLNFLLLHDLVSKVYPNDYTHFVGSSVRDACIMTMHAKIGVLVFKSVMLVNSYISSVCVCVCNQKSQRKPQRHVLKEFIIFTFCVYLIYS